jgi:small subunit ribosomal protein S6
MVAPERSPARVPRAQAESKGPEGEQQVSQIRQYELIYIVASDATEQQITDLHSQVEEITGRFSGKIDKSDNWGRRKLAYEIGPHKEGTYVLELISGSGELMKEIDRRLRVSDQVIRHLMVRVDEENRVIERARSTRKEGSQRRRVARGLPPERQPGEGPQRSEDDDDRFGGDAEEGL